MQINLRRIFLDWERRRRRRRGETV